MKRRNFIKSISIASAAGISLPVNYYASINKGKSSKKKSIKPERLKKGDTIGLITPGSFITEEELKESVENLKALGFNVKYSKAILDRYGYLAGKDEIRANDLMNMFADKEVDGIMCARGGYGCSRILPLLDYEIIKNNPKTIIGYSDITALLYGIYAKTGLVCFHGPVGISTFNDFSIYNFRNVLMNPSKRFNMISVAEKEDADYQITTIRSGIAEGELVGGNLSIVVSLIGTPYDVDTNGKILFLEEVGEEPYRVDRMLTQMIEANKFKGLKGIALGVFKNCEVKKDDPSFKTSFTLKEVLQDRLYGLGIPVIYGLSFGHIENKFTLPFGVKARLDVGNRILSLTETAVK